MSRGYRFEVVTVDDASLMRCARMLAEVFPDAGYSVELLRWQYRDNPAGEIVGWNAVASDGSLAAHYVVQPLEARVDGAIERGALSFNTATHPAHQGKGLFTALGMRTYATAAERGYGFVVGVANANSTPGFTRKLGFALVSSLGARVGPALRPHEESPAAFDRCWDAETIQWRAARPGARYRAIGDSLYAATPQPFVRALLARGSRFRGVARAPIGVRPIDLWLGLEPSGSPGPSVDIPKRFRPSPLNFIFLDLAGTRALDPSAVRFRAFDFDPY